MRLTTSHTHTPRRCQTGAVRYLSVVRHAKATAAQPGASDYERALSAKGLRQCAQLRTWAQEHTALAQYGPVTALVSSAKRTRETFERAFEGTAFVNSVWYSDLIYNGRRDVSAEELLVELSSVDPVTTSLMVVAHNPTLHELVEMLALKRSEWLRAGAYPLGGAFVFELPDDEPIGLSSYSLVNTLIPEGI